MSDEIQLVSDGDGLAVIGPRDAVERFLASENLPSTELAPQRLRTSLGAAAGLAQKVSDVQEQTGQWVRLTQESAEQIKKYGLMKSSTSGLEMGVVKAADGPIKHIVQFASGPGAALAGPGALAGVAGVMAQIAIQQAMEEVTDYLAAIDAKIDDLLRAQKDGVLADMIGVDLVVDEAMTMREHVGGVSEVTWSKVQATSLTVARTQAYALRRLDAIAEKIERTRDVPELAQICKQAEREVEEWLAVLAHCVRLQDATAVLELDRVLDAAPDELDRHRLGLRAARRNRLDLVSRSTQRLVARLDAAAGTANAKVLLHPGTARTVVHASNDVATDVREFHTRLGVEHEREALDARRWLDAVVDVKDRVIETGADGVGAARQAGAGAVGRARSAGSVLGRAAAGAAGKAAEAAEKAAGVAGKAAEAAAGKAADAAGALGGVVRQRVDGGGEDAPLAIDAGPAGSVLGDDGVSPAPA